MKLTILMDNNTYIDQYYLGEPAFSVYIEDGAEKILFDTVFFPTGIMTTAVALRFYGTNMT